jgi:HEAT repeat protein
MPRSFHKSITWRVSMIALALLVPIFVVGYRADAQRRRPIEPGTSVPASYSSDAQKKNLTRVNTSDTAEGSSITIFSDLPLNDYSAYRGGDRFYVLIPSADASRIVAGMRGRGFADVRAQKRGNDALISFRLLAGATARVSQKFNRLEILITVPALVTANSNSGVSNSNTNSGSQTNTSVNGSNTGAGNVNSNSRPRTGRGNSSRGNRNLYGAYSDGESTASSTSSSSTNPNIDGSPDGIPVGPDGTVTQSETTTYPPDMQASPIVSPSPVPSADQIAQLQPAPDLPGTNSQVPATTTAPSGDLTFGAQVKQNWLFILLAVVVAGLIAWVVFARTRESRSPVERRIESIRESRTSVGLADAPTPVRSEQRVVPEPVVSEFETPFAEEMVAPVMIPVGVADAVEDEPTFEEVDAEEIQPSRPVAVEQAAVNVTALLSGDLHDADVISTENPEARQMIAAELLAALSGRNALRHERARDAFVNHGFFDDATRTMRTAESPAERASAARSLGLVRDDSGTPHLVAALEDSSPEVRRAAVESLAEIRDPSAVAPLEALRDTEKDRNVPLALIQHAIEASVVGRLKVAPAMPTADEAPELFDLEPDVLSEGEESLVHEAESASEESLDILDELPEQPVELSAPGSQVETDALLDFGELDLDDVPSTAETPEPTAEGLNLEASPVADASLDVADDLIVPDETVAETSELLSDDWVDVDVSRESRFRHISTPPEAPIPTHEGVIEEEASEADPIAESLDEGLQAAPEVVHEPDEPAVLDSSSADAIITETESSAVATEVSEDERAIDVSGESDKEIVVAEGPEKEIVVSGESEKELDLVSVEGAGVSEDLLIRLTSDDIAARAAAVEELGNVGGEDAFREISTRFDDPSPDVRNAAARALFAINPDRAGSFTRALREASPERRRNIGSSLSSSGLATEAIGHLMGESRETTYDAFSLLFLMAKAGEVHPLMRAVEEHPNNEVRLAVVKLLALSGQQDILPAFRRLAVRGSLPTEVRSAVMEAIYQISSQSSSA